MSKLTPSRPVMVNFGEASKKQVKQKVVTKACAKCGVEKKLEEFYAHKMYTKGICRDRWCKECAKAMAISEVGLRDYMMHNNRLFTQELWNDAMAKAVVDCNKQTEYLLANDSEKSAMLTVKAGGTALLLMNSAKHYRYVNYEDSDFQFDVEEVAMAEQALERNGQDPYYTDPVYSPEWNGSYTQYEIKKMDDYYQSIIKARGIEDSIGETYCRQFVKQSAIVDVLAEKYRKDPTKDNDAQYKNAISSLEALSQAAQLAPRYRKADATIGLGSLGVLIKACEEGKLLMEPQTFPDDQIDGIIKNYMHVSSAIQGTGSLWTNDTSSSEIS